MDLNYEAVDLGLGLYLIREMDQTPEIPDLPASYCLAVHRLERPLPTRTAKLIRKLSKGSAVPKCLWNVL